MELIISLLTDFFEKVPIGALIISGVSLGILFAIRDTVKVFVLTIFNKVSSKISRIFKLHKFTKRDFYREIKIQDLLIRCRVENNADRANIYLFHNGGTFTTNNPQFKVSKTHESLNQGISSTFSFDKDIRCSSILNILLPLFDKGDNPVNGIQMTPAHKSDYKPKNPDEKCHKKCQDICYIINVERLDAGFAKSALKDQGVNFAVVCPLFSNKWEIIGYSSLHYCSLKDIDELQNYIKDLCQYSSDMSFFLNQNH